MKTLSDAREKLVNYKPHDSSIGRLRKKPHPHVGPNTKRIEGVETTNYRVAARLVEMKLEDDRDIHLVVSVPSAPAKTMIVEFPDTDLQRRLELTEEGEDGERPLRAHRGLRSALLQPLHRPQWQGDRHRGRLLRHPSRPDGSRAERDRAPSGLEVLGGELLALHRRFAWKAVLRRVATRNLVGDVTKEYPNNGLVHATGQARDCAGDRTRIGRAPLGRYGL